MNVCRRVLRILEYVCQERVGFSDLFRELLKAGFVEDRVLDPAPVPPEIFAGLHEPNMRLPIQPIRASWVSTCARERR